MSYEPITSTPEVLRRVLQKDANCHPDFMLAPDVRVEIAELAESLDAKQERTTQ